MRDFRFVLDMLDFELDVLPGRASIEVLMEKDPVREGFLARFRVSRKRLFRHREYSEWSGAFLYEGEPISLVWDAFWAK